MSTNDSGNRILNTSVRSGHKHLLLSWPKGSVADAPAPTMKLLFIGENEALKDLFVETVINNSLESKRHFIMHPVRFKWNGNSYAQINLMLWKVPSSERIKVGTINYYQDSLGIFLFYDMYDISSLQKLKEIWVTDMGSRKWEGVCMLVGIEFHNESTEYNGDKTIKQNERIISYDEGLTFAKENHMLYMECCFPMKLQPMREYVYTNKTMPTSHTPYDALSTLLYQVIEENQQQLLPQLSFCFPHKVPLSGDYLAYFHQCIAMSDRYRPIYPASTYIVDRTVTTSDKIDFTFEMLIVGDISCGKSAFLKALCDEISTTTTTTDRTDLLSNLQPTIGVDFNVTRMLYRWAPREQSTTAFSSTAPTEEKKNTTAPLRLYDIKLLLWAISGDERYASTTDVYFRSAYGFFLTYDVTNRQSFARIQSHWMPRIREHRGHDEHIPILLIGLKAPLAEENDLAYETFIHTLQLQSPREVSYQDGWMLAMQYGIPFLECNSVEMGWQVKDACSTMVHYALDMEFVRREVSRRVCDDMERKRRSEEEGSCILC